ncbi:MAG TPA: hypothetical protein VEC99_18355 [Clostridia bacterium]|nr:hypothetical protein [Clostridia bacterium]
MNTFLETVATATKMVAQGKLNGAFITSGPGMGKLNAVLETLEQLNKTNRSFRMGLMVDDGVVAVLNQIVVARLQGWIAVVDLDGVNMASDNVQTILTELAGIVDGFGGVIFTLTGSTAGVPQKLLNRTFNIDAVNLAG